jgi:ABC-type branched-subunit amino acid transport system substrate-binding protein
VRRHRAALVTPLSGPLALFGRAGATAFSLWARHAGVDLTMLDCHPSPSTAMRSAHDMRPDVVFGPYGAGPALAAARSSHLPLWNHGGATDRLAWPAFPGVVNIMAPARSYLAAVVRVLATRGLGGATVALVHGTTGFGQEVAAGAVAAAHEAEMAVSIVTFGLGSAAGIAEHVPRADVLLLAGSFADEVVLAAALLRRSWKAIALVSAGVDEVLAPLGALREGVYGPCQWIAAAAPVPRIGPDAAWFGRQFVAESGAPPPYPAAAAFGAGVLWEACAAQAGVANATDSARGLETSTLFGQFRLDPTTGLQVGHRVHVVQWRAGARTVVET